MIIENLGASALLAETDERRALRDSIAQLAGRYGRTWFQEVCRSGGTPDALWRDLGEAGFLGDHISEEHGGGGGMVKTLIVIEETAAQGCPFQYIVISPTIAGSILDHHGSDALKERCLGGIADGTLKMCF